MRPDGGRARDVAIGETRGGDTGVRRKPPPAACALPIEAALVKSVVDALMGLFRQGHDLTLKHNAEAALREAIRELLLANPDENKAAARIAIAKAAGILSEDVVLAEDMLRRHRDTRGRTRSKTGGSRKRASDAAAVEVPTVDKPAVKKKPAARKPGKTG